MWFATAAQSSWASTEYCISSLAEENRSNRKPYRAQLKKRVNKVLLPSKTRVR